MVIKYKSAFSNRYYVYTILSLKDYDLFTDITIDLRRRLDEHSRGLVVSTKIRIPFKLIHYEYFTNFNDAKIRGNYLRSSVGRAKLKETLRQTLKELRNYPYRLSQ